jgi:hypothetical protein
MSALSRIGNTKKALGSRGPRGPRGPRGLRGATGPRGVKGNTGVKGSISNYFVFSICGSLAPPPTALTLESRRLIFNISNSNGSYYLTTISSTVTTGDLDLYIKDGEIKGLIESSKYLVNYSIIFNSIIITGTKPLVWKVNFDPNKNSTKGLTSALQYDSKQLFCMNHSGVYTGVNTIVPYISVSGEYTLDEFFPVDDNIDEDNNPVTNPPPPPILNASHVVFNISILEL